MKAKVIFYSQKEISPDKRTKFKKELAGHNDSSHGGRYKYRVEGILDKIKYIKPCNASLIILKKDFKIITDLMNKYSIKFKDYNIDVEEKEFNE
jgi:hypothetical protein